MFPITFNYTGQITSYTVSQSGSYFISAYGAQGGSNNGNVGSLGASVGGSFTLQADTRLLVIVGGVGQNGGGGGGGGGSFVFVDNDRSGTLTFADSPLVAAGGGGGAGTESPGTAGYSANDVGGSGNGSGGAGGSTNFSGGGGAGVLGGGGNGAGSFSASGATSINSSGTGRGEGGNGGYGGGGGGGFNGAGGGGGFSGGEGGSTGRGATGGEGGRSYNLSNGSESFTQAGVQSGNGLVEIVCYAQGTRIRTMGGEVVVDALRVGDLAVTASGEARPIRWIGHRKVECRRHPQASLVMPVRIAAGAFGPGKPARDLTVSPAHALCVEADGREVLIPAIRLVNGTTITQPEAETVTYWHVELDSHDILLAEGLPAESYLDCGNRRFFANADATDLTAVPDARPEGPLPFCRPFHEAGPVVDLVRARLQDRAVALGWHKVEEAFAGLHLVADGRSIRPDVEGLTARFVVPTDARDVRLVSATSVPAHVVSESTDDRRLGVALAALTIDDGLTGARVIEPDDARLGEGFHAVNSGARWTDGSAVLPSALWAGCKGSFFLRVELAVPALPRWIAPGDTAGVVNLADRRQA